MLVVLTMRPIAPFSPGRGSCASICRTAAWVVRNVPVRWTSTTLSNVSRSILRRLLSLRMPAPLTSTATPPNARTAAGDDRVGPPPGDHRGDRRHRLAPGGADLGDHRLGRVARAGAVARA